MRERPSTLFVITALASTWPLPINCFCRSNACIWIPSLKGRVSGWRRFTELFAATRGESGRRRKYPKGLYFILRCLMMPTFEDKLILLIENDPDDGALTMRAFKRNNIRSQVVTARSGVEALNYLVPTSAPDEGSQPLVPDLI